MPTRRTFDKAEFLPNDNSKPHIIPDVLYPAIGGKLLDGTTSHSGNYGTSQSDSRKYYYTDIKGSKPIRDPRIGAYFGSQRFNVRSSQDLEQETATNGVRVQSLDGREWCRAVGENWNIKNDEHGHDFELHASNESVQTHYVEIVGYFNAVNILGLMDSYSDQRLFSLNGTANSSTTDYAMSLDSSPLKDRYVNGSSVMKVDFDSSPTLGINTVKFQGVSGSYFSFAGFELIAQDTTNAVTRNKIQIPSQTVFSFGSKFTVGGSSAARHYDPFSAKSDGTGWTSPTSGTNTPNSSAAWPSNIDTATSLGLAKWVDGTNYYRPYNGGRVVNWVDENGEIKTSVNVMPPNAKSIADSGTLSNATAKSNGSAPNDNFRPTFEAHTSNADEDLLSEVAKTFHFREFGNGSANGGAVTSSTGGNFKDASMLNTNADIAYVMDDGLTSFCGQTADYSATHGLWIDADNHQAFFTFIGTGVGWDSGANGKNTWAQNLSYGTHIVHYYAGNHQNTAYIAIDGIQVKGDFSSSGGNNYIYNWAFGGASGDITFHQPKMPPIPEGACIIADYMLMADFVIQSTTVTLGDISKGVRMVSASRDFFVDSSSSLASGVSVHTQQPMGLIGFSSGTAVANASLPFFGTRFLISMEGSNLAHELTINGSSVTETVHDCSVDNDGDLKGIPDASVASLGLNTASVGIISGSFRWHFGLFDSPIHTSHHYKTFETPFLHELIGGDRNMEQTHLICSADGKTWDEVTRDMSYMGNQSLLCHCDTLVNSGSSTNYIIFDDWRGGFGNSTQRIYHNKDFAIAYDRVICTRKGTYFLYRQMRNNGYSTGFRINDNQLSESDDGGWDTTTTSFTVSLDVGDYIQISGGNNGSYEAAEYFQITRVK